jgi:4a-hydroxytetrahydrobiopterin dehydratase
MPALTADEVETRLQEMAGWHLEDGAIARTFVFPTYADGVAFAVKVALAAERQDHHPDLLITYKKVRVAYLTHSEGGVTEKDLEAADRVSRL